MGLPRGVALLLLFSPSPMESAHPLRRPFLRFRVWFLGSPPLPGFFPSLSPPPVHLAQFRPTSPVPHSNLCTAGSQRHACRCATASTRSTCPGGNGFAPTPQQATATKNKSPPARCVRARRRVDRSVCARRATSVARCGRGCQPDSHGRKTILADADAHGVATARTKRSPRSHLLVLRDPPKTVACRLPASSSPVSNSNKKHNDPPL